MEKQKDVFITLNDKEVKLPRTFKEKILWLGPSLVLCSIAIGSGEAIITLTSQRCMDWDYYGFQ